MQEEKRQAKFIGPEQALQKARAFCAYQERCHQEMRDKLYEWGLYPDAVENILSTLISENFLNEERFAKAYAGGKFRIKGWGRTKIRLALKAKKISEYCIKKGLQEIDPLEYEATLQKLIQQHSAKLPEKNPLRKKYRIAQSIIAKGYEPDLVWNYLDRL